MKKPCELTEAGIRAAIRAVSGARQEISDGAEKGLRLRIGPDAAAWSVLVRDGNDRARLALGSWPEISIDEARSLARERREHFARRYSGSIHTVGHLLEQYERFRIPHLKRGRSTMQSLRDICSPLMFRDPHTLTRRDIARVINEKALTAPSHANRQLAYLRAVFSWAVKQGMLAHNPVDGIPKPAREESRDRAPSLEDLRAIWEGCETRPLPYGAIVQTLMLTACRLEEVAQMRREELDLSAKADGSSWTLPSGRAKNGRSVTIPLSRQARRVIEEAMANHNSDYVFSLTGTPFCGWSKGKAALDRAISSLGYRVAGWRHHDLRRAFATLACEELDIRREVVDRCLNHTGAATRSTVARVYDRSTMLKQRRRALQSWADLVLPPPLSG